jgi:hypothetical protein
MLRLNLQWDILKTRLKLARHRKVKNIFKHIIMHFLDLAPTQTHNHAYSPVGNYFDEQGISTRGNNCILHNSREPTTISLYLNFVKVKVKQSRYTP